MGERLRGRAFGIELDVGYPAPGLAATEPPPGPRMDRTLSLDLAPSDEVGAMAGSDPERISDNAGLIVDDGGDRGYVIRSSTHGSHWISSDGRHAFSAPPEDVDDWFWQRLLTGQVLPFAALVQGLEVFHAGAVAVGGRAIALTGPSGAGKSTLIAALGLRGNGFIADDVVAVEAVGADGLTVYPAPGLANLRRTAGEFVDTAVAGLPGAAVGEDEHQVRLCLDAVPGPLEMDAFVFLGRDPEASESRVEPAGPADPRELLSTTFNFVLRDGPRLARLLDICARIARKQVFRVTIAPDSDPAATAAAIEAAVAR